MRRSPLLPLGIASALFALCALLSGLGGPKWAWITLVAQAIAAFTGAYFCARALQNAGASWLWRSRGAWACIAASGVFFGVGCLVSVRGANPNLAPAPADYWWIPQQPLLWLGLFLLAWRGQRLAMMRLLTDTLIVVLAAVVLSWSVLLEKLLTYEQFSPVARMIALYYPVCDIAHLFCALILIANVRDRPALRRGARWLLAGVVCLIAADSLGSYFFFARQPGMSLWLDLLQGISYPLMGVGALIHAQSERETVPQEVELGEIEGRMVTIWERTLGRWHRSAMLWLPYVATLGVSGVLVGQEIQKSNVEAVRRLLPVLALLLAIVARQMITLWDNLRLSEQLRLKADDLEHNVGERTRHLKTLHGITSTLNTSLDKRTVLRVTLQQTRVAVGADGGGIWLRDIRRDVYSEGVPLEEWSLMDWQGLENDPTMPTLLRELSIVDASMQMVPGREFKLSPATREAVANGRVPHKNQMIQVPVSSQGELLGVMALVRKEGKFTYEDRALVESVALEAGTALQNARLYDEAAVRANHDSVTDLFNHRAVQEQLHATLARCKKTGGTFSLVMMDLNNFKFFNDTYGHPVGDDVLRAVAAALRESCRASDILGRYGGDEFIVVLPDTDGPTTLEVCGRIKAALDARHFEPIPGTRLPIATSFGWANFPGDGENALDLLTAADQHLYNHKRGNTSRFMSENRQSEDREELRRLKNRTVGGSFGVLDALVTAIDNKDHYTRHHSEEVTYLSLLVARELGYDARQLEAVRISGLLHDVGKIAVPDDVLRHPGKLGPQEWEIMQQHPVFGALIVKDVPHLEHVTDGIRYHHEKWDGSGYPEKLAGENIPEMGRLLAMGDCYSALTTDRPYRKGWKPEAALEEIARCAGSHFDPHLCAVFLQVMAHELELDGATEDYGARIADDLGQLARQGQTKTGAPIVARETVSA